MLRLIVGKYKALFPLHHCFVMATQWILLVPQKMEEFTHLEFKIGVFYAKQNSNFLRKTLSPTLTTPLPKSYSFTRRKYNSY